MAEGGSVVVRRQLGAKLRQLRIDARKTPADVGVAGLASRAKLHRLEGGKLPVKVADVWALCRLYGVDDETTDALAKLAPGTQADDWWEESFGDAVPDWFGLYTGLEMTASRIRAFDPEVVHGRLQTPEYAALVIGEDDPRVSPDVVDQRVRFRMERQRAVRAQRSATFVMVETALLFGPPEVLEPQIDHLRSVAAKPNIDILVLPFSARTYPRRGRFTLFDFDHAAGRSGR